MILILYSKENQVHDLMNRIKKSHVYCETLPYTCTINDIKLKRAEGIIIADGVESLPNLKDEVFKLGLPILTIGCGTNVIDDAYNGKSSIPASSTYNFENVKVKRESLLFNGMIERINLWLNKECFFEIIPEGFETIAEFKGKTVAIEKSGAKIYGIKFHPEVENSVEGKCIIENFLFKICNCDKNLEIEELVEKL